MKNRIQSIQLNNFKFFQEELPIELNGNNLLLYGENGSGKSSLYWAIYTLFEASLKSEGDDIRKYFSKVIKPKDNLINIHAKETANNTDDYNSFIELLTTDSPSLKYRISKTDVDINTSEGAKFSNYASDFINYRMLQSLSAFQHSDDIDLFWMFVGQIFKYVRFQKVAINRDGKKLELTNAYDIWLQIEKGNEYVGTLGVDEKWDTETIKFYKDKSGWKEFDDLVKSFNSSLNKLIDSINILAPEYFKKLGYDFLFSIKLKREVSYNEDLTKYEFIPFELGIEIPEYEKEINALHKPHSFLNEAKLSAMAISIRLAILSEKRLEDCLKFIVLDDLLISLDMRNREKVLELLLSADFIDNYQIIILTHDRMFYQMAKHKIDILGQDNWKYIEMYDTKDEKGNSKPHIIPSKSYYQKAEEFYAANNLPEAANNLRKAGEEF